MFIYLRITKCCTFSKTLKKLYIISTRFEVPKYFWKYLCQQDDVGKIINTLLCIDIITFIGTLLFIMRDLNKWKNIFYTFLIFHFMNTVLVLVCAEMALFELRGEKLSHVLQIWVRKLFLISKITHMIGLLSPYTEFIHCACIMKFIWRSGSSQHCPPCHWCCKVIILFKNANLSIQYGKNTIHIQVTRQKLGLNLNMQLAVLSSELGII